MEIHFLGVGEACDGRQPNTSILVKTADDQKAGRILLDCGFSVPHQYLALEPSADELEFLWISHFHGDHFLGTPLLLLWFWEMDRTKPLHIIGPPGIENAVVQAMKLAYPNFLARLNYPLVFHEIGPENPLHLTDTLWKTAYNEHSQPCLSLRLSVNEKSIFYSGDGRPTGATLSLANRCDMIIHEAYALADSFPGHGSIETCLAFARNAGVKRLALVHIQRDLRRQCPEAFAGLLKDTDALEIILPESGARFTL